MCGREPAVGVTSPPQWPLLIVTTLTGLLGSLIDSFLGATLQYSGEYCSYCANNNNNNNKHICIAP